MCEKAMGSIFTYQNRKKQKPHRRKPMGSMMPPLPSDQISAWEVMMRDTRP